MPAFILHGFNGSTNVDRIRLTLAEGAFTDFEFKIVDLLKGEQKVRLFRFPDEGFEYGIFLLVISVESDRKSVV